MEYPYALGLLPDPEKSSLIFSTTTEIEESTVKDTTSLESDIEIVKTKTAPCRISDALDVLLISIFVESTIDTSAVP